MGAGRVQGVDGNDAVGLVREEARGVVDIHDGGPAEDLCVVGRREDSDGLIDPVVEVGTRRVAPVLVSRYQVSGII